MHETSVTSYGKLVYILTGRKLQYENFIRLEDKGTPEFERLEKMITHLSKAIDNIVQFRVLESHIAISKEDALRQLLIEGAKV